MSGNPPDRMKSVNVQLTEDVIGKLDELGDGNRSHAARIILGAILSAWNDEDEGPLRMAASFSQATGSRIRRALSDAGLEKWRKAIVWIPASMQRELSTASECFGTRYSDMIRGAIFGAFDIDPSSRLSSEGHEFWVKDVQTGTQD